MLDHVCNLNESLYGTNEAGEISDLLLDKQLKEWGFKNLEYDNRIDFYVPDSELNLFVIFTENLAFTSFLPGLKSKLEGNFDIW